jgi:hypothetical protein
MEMCYIREHNIICGAMPQLEFGFYIGTYKFLYFSVVSLIHDSGRPM